MKSKILMENAFKIEVIGSVAGLQTLQNARATTFLLEGANGIGKVNLALYHIAATLCLNEKNLPTSRIKIPCGNCKHCKEVFFFKSPHVFFLSLENRLPFLYFLYAQLVQNLTNHVLSGDGENATGEALNENVGFAVAAPKTIETTNNSSELTPVQYYLVQHLKREVCRLLSLHRYGRIPLYPPTTRTRDGIQPLKFVELETRLHSAYSWISNFSKQRTCRDLLSFLVPRNLVKRRKAKTKSYEKYGSYNENIFIFAPDFFDNMQTLQNSLQRSVYLKESLDKMFLWCQRGAGNKAVVLDGLQFVQTTAAGSFLKILEEPPANLRFYVTTQAATKLHAEVRLPLLSRLTKFSLTGFTKNNFPLLAEKFGFNAEQTDRWLIETGLGRDVELSVQHLYALQRGQQLERASSKGIPSSENMGISSGDNNSFPMHALVFKNPLNLGSVHGVREGNAALFYAFQFLDNENFVLSEFFDEVEELIEQLGNANISRLRTLTSKVANNKQTKIVEGSINEHLPIYLRRCNPLKLKLIFRLTFQLKSRLQKRLTSEKNAFAEWWLFVQPLTSR